MKFVKTLFLAALVMGSVAPAFANDEIASGDEGITASDSAVSPNAFDHDWDHGDDWDRGGDWGHGRGHRRPRPMFHVCFARNAIGRTFAARGWDIRFTQYQAVRACRAYSFGPLGFTCRPVGCR